MIVFISVDLPAPLSPTSATALPASTEKRDAAQSFDGAEGLADVLEFKKAHRRQPSLLLMRSSQTARIKHRADGDLLIERPNGHQIQPVLQYPHDQRADQRANHAAPAAEQVRAAENGRGDGGEFVA